MTLSLPPSSMCGSVANGLFPPFLSNSMCGILIGVPRIELPRNGLFPPFATLPRIAPPYADRYLAIIRRDYYFTQREWDRTVGYGKVPKERELGDLIEDKVFLDVNVTPEDTVITVQSSPMESMDSARKLMREINGCNCPDCLEGHCPCTANGECQDCLCEKCGA